MPRETPKEREIRRLQREQVLFARLKVSEKKRGKCNRLLPKVPAHEEMEIFKYFLNMKGKEDAWF